MSLGRGACGASRKSAGIGLSCATAASTLMEKSPGGSLIEESSFAFFAFFCHSERSEESRRHAVGDPSMRSRVTERRKGRQENHERLREITARRQTGLDHGRQPGARYG